MNFFQMILKFFKILCKAEQDNPTKIDNPIVPPATEEENTLVGKKLALIVGINKYEMPGADLNGCVNDAEDVWQMLTERGFDPEQMRMLVDERATQQNILERLEWLVSNLEAGDIGYFHYSGHGSHIRARHGDTSELDDYQTELLCPTDLDWDNPLTDDILADYFKRVPEGAFLYFVADCCHSGSMSRGITASVKPKNDWKPRYIAPPIDISIRSRGRDLSMHRLGRRSNNDRSFGNNVYVIDQRHLLLSGCRDDQTSADAFVGGKWGGALSQNFLRVINENKDKSWKEIHELLLTDIAQQGYAQVPQLTGPEDVINKKVLG